MGETSGKKIKDLAKELGVSCKTIVEMLKEEGYAAIKSYSNVLTLEMETLIRRKFEERRKKYEESLAKRKKIWKIEEKIPSFKKDTRRKEKKKKRISKKEIERKLKETFSKIKKPKIKKYPTRPKKIGEKEETEEKRVIKVPAVLKLVNFAKLLGVEPIEIINKAFHQGITLTLNQNLDYETMVLLGEEFGVDIQPEEVQVSTLEEIRETKGERRRPPVVALMGHVDHGKTTLLDKIRGTKIAEKEFGGITQRMYVAMVEYKGHKLTFIDTPGHEAFVTIRSRGAQATDIAVIVVSAVEGVKPQTIEAINHAKIFNVPMIVAINKIDLPEADPEKVKRQLSEIGLIPDDWGGDTMMVEVSALTGQGVNDLLEAILLKAEEMDLRADYETPAKGVVLESEIIPGKGTVGIVLVKSGTLRIGDYFVAGTTWGKVRAMYNEKGERLKEAFPSTPVILQGFEDLPQAGDVFYVVENEKEAKKKSAELKRELEIQRTKGELSLAYKKVVEGIKSGELKELPVIIKADRQGSAEAIADELSRLVYKKSKVGVKVIYYGVGNVTESDVLYASASDAIILYFNVKIDPKAREKLKELKVVAEGFKLIHELIDRVKMMLRGLLEPKYVEKKIGEVEIKKVFRISGVGRVAGCYVRKGLVKKGAKVKIKRNEELIHEGEIISLKHFDKDVNEIKEGYECGLRVKDFDKYKEGDILEVYELEKIKVDLEN